VGWATRERTGGGREVRGGGGGGLWGNGETQKRTVRKGICSEEGEKGTRQRQQQRQRQRQR